MSPAATATERAVRGAAAAAWSGPDRRSERLLILRAAPRWHGASRMDHDGLQYTVVPAVSALAVRDALTQGDEDRVVVLTDLEDEEIGIGVLAHAVRQRSMVLDVWDTVRQQMRVRDVLDSNLVRDGETVARALVDREPADGWPPAPGGVLTRDHAYRCLVSTLLGLAPRQLDVPGVLDWSRHPSGVLALHDLDEPLARLLVSWLVDQLDVAAVPVLDLCRTGHGTDAIALGLVASHLYGRRGSERGQGAFDQRYFRRLRPAHVQPWAAASTGWVERALVTDHTAALQVLGSAEAVLRDLQGDQAVGESRLLPGGLGARADALGRALAQAVAGDTGQHRAAEAAILRLEEHVLARSDPRRVEPGLMGVRLLRWLATPAQVPATTHDALRWQVQTGAWVDRARQVVWNGADQPQLGEGLAVVFEAATLRRQTIDRAAALLLAEDVVAERAPGRVVPVEDAVRREVLPLAQSQPVLLLVLDGMSVAVACELAESVSSLGWGEIEHEGDGRAVVLAGLPTVTEVSRTSLLSGRRQRGGQREERVGLAEIAGAQARLFHLGDLAGGAGAYLPPDVREAVLDADRPLVAAVLNAVDDSLSGGDPARTRWTVDAVRHLRPLLEQAAVAGRVVVLVSDHGHVVDRPDSGILRSVAGGGARWRQADGAAQEDEVLLAGSRVLLGDGRVVAAVDETLRYRARHEGYHGGASLAEVTIPLLVFTRHGSAPMDGWQRSPDHEPTWWRSAVGAAIERQEQGSESATLF